MKNNIKKFQEFIKENAVIDEILDKISDSGMDSLTPEEKNVLDGFSQTGKVPEKPKTKPTFIEASSPSSPKDIEVFVEKSQDGVLLLDFIDESEYEKFLEITGFDKKPSSMIKIIRSGQKAREGENYHLKREVLEMWIKEDRIIEIDDSYIMGYEVNMNGSSVKILS